MRVIEQTVGQFYVPVVLGNNSRAAGPALPLAARRWRSSRPTSE
ncbi:hypothetical protein P8A22_37380 [Streptomyces laculatispora]|uniref:Uncharacterized protein n=1 Tax=Streptomyces laculatispora TaxID=887464 RepID=A0ABY9IDY8_9ACTN|nr:hypothetical protein [Streptomyces laculatispora]WLQ45060.1 hypothetical protein P8A22_37380 [Streptomyces laculatispora]